MQDSWGEKECSVAASRHSSWEDEEEGGGGGGGMWNSTGSQGSGSSWGQGSNGGWGQSHPGKKPNIKVGHSNNCFIKCSVRFRVPAVNTPSNFRVLYVFYGAPMSLKS